MKILEVFDCYIESVDEEFAYINMTQTETKKEFCGKYSTSFIESLDLEEESKFQIETFLINDNDEKAQIRFVIPNIINNTEQENLRLIWFARWLSMCYHEVLNDEIDNWYLDKLQTFQKNIFPHWLKQEEDRRKLSPKIILLK